MILGLLPVQLHDDREHKQGILASTAPNSLCTLSKQLYYGSTNMILLLLPVESHDDREHKQGTSLCTLSKQLYYNSRRCDLLSVPSQFTIS